MKSINQQHLAEQLNLSRTTVSRSLANHPAISSDTRARVQKLAYEMGYRGDPGRAVRRSRQNRPVTIGVVIGVPEQNVALATFPFILQGIRERADLEHLAVDVCYQPPATLDPESRRQPVFRQIRNGDWRGAMLIYPFPEPAVDLIARKISTVAILESYANRSVDTVDTDEVAGIVAMTERLIAAGHRRIGFVTWNYPVGGHWGLRRFGGYVEALFAHGLEFNAAWTCNIQRNEPRRNQREIAEHVIRMLREQRVTGWVCAADHQAYALMQALEAQGVRVPEACSVTGFDGLPPPPGMKPVASMRVPHEDIGASAVARLLNRIMHPKSPRRKILVEALRVDGASIAPPAP